MTEDHSVEWLGVGTGIDTSYDRPMAVIGDHYEDARRIEPDELRELADAVGRRFEELQDDEDEEEIFVHEVSINDHPVTAGEDDDRTDVELLADTEAKVSTSDDLDMPDWVVEESDPPDMPTVRYTMHVPRINVRAPRDTPVFEELAAHIEIEGLATDKLAMSSPMPTPDEDFDGPIHLDLTEGSE